MEALAFLGPLPDLPWRKVTTVAGALSDSVVERLANSIRKPGDLSKVKGLVGARNLSSEALEDAYLRIAIRRKVLQREEAETLFKNLRGVKGFSGTLGKVSGLNKSGTIGHLTELRVANAAAVNGYKVEGIGLRYSDGLKNGMTDLDVLISKQGKIFAIESKAYEDVSLQSFSNTMRPDMDSLVAYKNMARKPASVFPVFTVTVRPSDLRVRELLELETAKRKIQLIYGSPDEQVAQIVQLQEIL